MPDRDYDGGRAASRNRTVGRWGLGAVLLVAGIAHLTFARNDFRAQVPDWLPLDVGFVVVGSGLVEIGLAVALVSVPRRHRATVGWVVAAFFVAVFPGNVSQFVDGDAAFGLDSDLARGLRLLGQPVLVAWSLWSTGAWRQLRRGRATPRTVEAT